VFISIVLYLAKNTKIATLAPTIGRLLVELHEAAVEDGQTQADQEANVARYVFFRLVALLMPCAIGYSLVAILSEEYNSRPDEKSSIFWIQLSACVVFPLTGLFLPGGEKAVCGVEVKRKSVLLRVNYVVHHFFVLYFLGCLSITNLMYVREIVYL
jgi:hypothetical protein